MRDPRIDRLAMVLVNYSTGIKPGQLVRLSGDPIATPLLEALYEQVIKAGAHPFIKMTPNSASEIFLKNASDQQLAYVNPLALQEVQAIDVSIGIWAETNTKALSHIDPKKQSIASSARTPISSTFMKRAAIPDGEKGKLYWCGTLFPTQASAQDAQMSLAEYCDFVYQGGHLDKPDPIAQWRQVEKSQQLVADYLTGTKEIHFETANGTDLRVNVQDMTWVNCCGKENFPDGEVFTGPNLKAKCGGVNGTVNYSFPAVHNGREVNDIQLTFEKGRVVNAKASSNQDFLNQMLDMDPGARSVGEVAIGTNYNIQQYTKNTLFDEKIGGTFHLAVGAGYPETGNANQSGLHWDMVCDLRTGGTIKVDGKTISIDGKFVFDGWPGND